MSESKKGKRSWWTLRPRPPQNAEAAYSNAILAIILSLCNWPVQALTLAAAFPPSHISGLRAVIAAMVPILCVAVVLILGFLGLRAQVGSSWLKAISGLAIGIAIPPALVALISAYMFLAQF